MHEAFYNVHHPCESSLTSNSRSSFLCEDFKLFRFGIVETVDSSVPRSIHPYGNTFESVLLCIMPFNAIAYYAMPCHFLLFITKTK